MRGERTEVCPSCGFDGRQANEYRGGVLWRTCHDPWHALAAPTAEETP